MYEEVKERASAVDVLVALGTHRPLSEGEICERLELSAAERQGEYKGIRFFNHEWDKKETFITIGEIDEASVRELSGGWVEERVEVAINRKVLEYDEYFIVGPVFPHEVVGFSGGHKYLFPGVAGEEIIGFFHWLGACISCPQIIGNIRTPTREVVERAAAFVEVPGTLFGLVARHERLEGLFIGEVQEAWEEAAALSKEVHVVYKERPFKTVLGIAPKRYEDLWTAGKVMYKLEPIVADGGTLIIYGPHIDTISYSHGKWIERVGYHTRDYFLKQMEKFADVPRGVLAHCSHVKGIGRYEDGLEKPRINVFLATGISRAVCRKVNLGYMNPEIVDLENYREKEHRGVLVVDDAGEVLHKLADGSVPSVD
jgi:nickel-dependent lactate racemase